MHGSIAGIQFALVNRYWEAAALFSALIVFNLFSSDCRVLWSDAPRYRNSLVAHAVFQLTLGLIGYLSGNRNFSTIALIIGLPVFFLLIPAMLEYARERGTKSRRKRGVDAD